MSRQYRTTSANPGIISSSLVTVNQNMTLIDIKTNPGSLTLGEVPNDIDSVIIAPTQDVDLAGKIKQLWIDSQCKCSVIPTASGNSDQDTLTVPRSLLVDTNSMLKFVRKDYSRTMELISTLNSELTDQAEMISLSRSFFYKFGEALREIEDSEENLNQVIAAARIASCPISTVDAQSLPSQTLIDATIDNENEYVDQSFIDTYPDNQGTQLIAENVISEAVDKAPKMLGIAGDVVTDVLVDLNPEEFKNEFSVIDITEGTDYDQAKKGLLSMFSSKVMLSTPIELGLVTKKGDDYIVLVTTIEPTYQILNVDESAIAANVPIDSVDKFNKIFKTVQVSGQSHTEEVVVPASIANTPITKMDWIVTATWNADNEAFAARSISHDKLTYATKKLIYFNASELATTQFTRSDNVSFRGFTSGRTFTPMEARANGSALSGIWNKLKSIKFPSIDTLQKASGLLSAGLGIAGEITGKSCLVKASGIMDVFNQGFGAIASSFQPHSRAAKVEIPQGTINHVATSVMPNLTKIGVSQVQMLKRSKTNIKRDMYNIHKAIIDGISNDKSSSQAMSRSKIFSVR